MSFYLGLGINLQYWSYPMGIASLMLVEDLVFCLLPWLCRIVCFTFLLCLSLLWYGKQTCCHFIPRLENKASWLPKYNLMCVVLSTYIWIITSIRIDQISCRFRSTPWANAWCWAPSGILPVTSSCWIRGGVQWRWATDFSHWWCSIKCILQWEDFFPNSFDEGNEGDRMR